MVRPGDEIIIDTKLDEQIGNAAFMSAKIKVDSKLVLQISYACALVG